jgi:restriction system protein
MKAFFVRANNGVYTDIYRKHGFVANGFFREPLSDYSNRDELTKQYQKDFPHHTGLTIAQNIGQIYRFWNQIKENDVVISTYSDGRLIIGSVISKPYFKKDDICPFAERINIKWLNDTFDRKELQVSTQNTIKSSLTIFGVHQIHDIAKLANIKLPDSVSAKTNVSSNYNHDLIIGSIRAKLLELDDSEFEFFVSYILQALGFEAKKRVGCVGDGGIDFEGTLDVFGVAITNLQVQVKRYESTSIGEKDIRNFRGALKRDYQGTFITLSDFNKKAKESAADPEKIPINLINGKQLIEIFIERYDDIIELIENDENEKLKEKLTFKRTIIPI